MKKIKGFTLVELVIVIAIVIILSVVSVPIYRGYTRQAKYSEGYALLGTILSSQKAYYSQYGNFLYSSKGSAGSNFFTSNDEILGIDARGNKYFSSFNIGFEGVANGMLFNFYAYVVKPEELRSEESRSLLQLYYNVTTGSKYTDNVKS